MPTLVFPLSTRHREKFLWWMQWQWRLWLSGRIKDGDSHVWEGL